MPHCCRSQLKFAHEHWELTKLRFRFFDSEHRCLLFCLPPKCANAAKRCLGFFFGRSCASHWRRFCPKKSTTHATSPTPNPTSPRPPHHTTPHPTPTPHPRIAWAIVIAWAIPIDRLGHPDNPEWFGHPDHLGHPEASLGRLCVAAGVFLRVLSVLSVVFVVAFFFGWLRVFSFKGRCGFFSG